MVKLNGAGDEARTHDPKLGRLVLYQLSYTRLLLWYHQLKKSGGARWIRTIEGINRQIYSLLPLATRESRPILFLVELLTGFEPATVGLQNRCSTN